MGDPGAPTRIPDPRLQSYPESLASDVGALEHASERTFLVRGGPPTLSEGSLSSPRLIACPPPFTSHPRRPCSWPRGQHLWTRFASCPSVAHRLRPRLGRSRQPLCLVLARQPQTESGRVRDTPLARAEAHHPPITEQALDGLPPPHPRHRVPGGQGRDGAPRPRAPDPAWGVPCTRRILLSEPLCSQRPPGGAHGPGTAFGAGSGKESLC